MGRFRRSFSRTYGQRSYKKLFVIATEGKKTEPAYFRMLADSSKLVKIKCIKGDAKSAPGYVLKRMALCLQEEDLQKGDEAWIVIDQDQWEEHQLETLFVWEKATENRGIALSNPNFEYWLLLHFEEGTKLAHAEDCSRRLKKYIPGYDKGIDSGHFTSEQVRQAVERARARTKGKPAACFGSTSVYRLVENILTARD